MTALKWLLIVVSVGYVCGLLALFFAQRAVLFPVPTTARTAPQAAGFPEAEEHILTTADGEKVIVWHVPARPGRPVVLYFHGNGDYLAGFFGRFRSIIADGTGIVALSYRGYAGSTGQPSEQGLLQDAAAAYAFTAARYRADNIVVWGFSLGTGVAVALAAEQRIGRLILEAPYTSIADVAASAFWFAPVRLLMRDQFRSDGRIATGQGSAARDAWRARSHDTRCALANGCLRWRTSRNGLSALPGAVITIWTISAAIEIARNFINLARG